MLKTYPVTDPIKAGEQVHGLIDGGPARLFFTAPIDLKPGYMCVVDTHSKNLMHIETSTGVIWSSVTRVDYPNNEQGSNTLLAK